MVLMRTTQHNRKNRHWVKYGPNRTWLTVTAPGEKGPQHDARGAYLHERWDPTMRSFHTAPMEAGHMHGMGFCGGCCEIRAHERSYSRNSKTWPLGWNLVTDTPYPEGWVRMGPPGTGGEVETAAQLDSMYKGYAEP